MTVELNLTEATALFLLASVVVVFGAMALARAGDVIAARTGLGHLWVGFLLIAGITSLPELVTNVAAVRIDNPSLAAGNVFGANMLNISKLALILAVFGSRNIFKQLSVGHERLSIHALVLTGLALTFVVWGTDLNWLGITPAAVSILLVFLLGSRFLYVASKGDPDLEEDAPTKSLRWGWTVFAISAIAVAASATALTISADAIAEETGISASFVGVLAVAFVTSLPELIVGITAVRIGAPQLAIAGLYGSNSFNIAILAIADIAYTERSLFSALDTSHIVAGGFATLLMAFALIQISLRRKLQYVSITEPSTALISIAYVVGIYLVYRTA
jgi:cation:H+ antiporter